MLAIFSLLLTLQAFSYEMNMTSVPLDSRGFKPQIEKMFQYKKSQSWITRVKYNFTVQDSKGWPMVTKRPKREATNLYGLDEGPIFYTPTLCLGIQCSYSLDSAMG